MDDRAHGASEGRYIGFGCLDQYDGLRWAAYLAARFPGEDLFLHGISMGAATVLCMSGLDLPPEVRGVVADCGFSSAWDQCRHVLRRDYRLPAFPLLHLTDLICRAKAGYSLRDHPARERVAATALPVLFFHGGADDFVPVGMTLECHEACAGEKRLVIVPEAGHAACHAADPVGYEAAVRAFLEEHAAGA